MNEKHFNEDLIAGYTAYVTPAEIAADHGDQAPGATPGTTVTIVGTIVIPTTINLSC
ncbi:LxmA leader domain family RiPP [Streptomyces sp. NPDC021056]|uniref:LxmA leader domain family RiPP n=1 Tax=Streptomyces sp. NPDC021056 TaxID=3155012 RepID=UPI0033DC1AC4